MVIIIEGKVHILMWYYYEYYGNIYKNKTLNL